MKFFCKHCRGITYLEIPDIDYAGCGHCDEVIEVPKGRFDRGVVIADDFVIMEHVGTGGMGLVYKALQISLERVVALKVLKDSFSKDKTFVQKFISEARSAALLRHQNIVQSFAVGNDNGIYYIAMEFVDGQTVSEMMLRKSRFSESETIRTGVAVANALDYAWNEKQLLHRDIKPDNIMIDKSGRVKLMDLGLSCSLSELKEHEEVIGTPQYISPDQFSGKPIDFRADQYSLGATLYHMVTGQFPFDAETAEQTAWMHIHDPLTPPDEVRKEISGDLSETIEKMMTKSPEKRYKSYEELSQALITARKPKKKKLTRTKKQRKPKKEPEFDTIIGIEESSGTATAHFKKPYGDVNDILKYASIAVIILAIIAAILVKL